MGVSIDLHPGDLKALTDFLRTTPAELATAQRRALNKTVTQGRNRIQREIPLNLPAKRIKQDLRVIRATPKRLEASVDAHDNPPGLHRFLGFTETRGRLRANAAGGLRVLKRAGAQGIKVKVRKDQPPVRYPHGFVLRHGQNIRGTSAHRALSGTPHYADNDFELGDVQPDTRYNPGDLVGRHPLLLLKGPSVQDEFAARIDRFKRDLVAAYASRLDHEVAYVLSKRK